MAQKIVWDFGILVMKSQMDGMIEDVMTFLIVISVRSWVGTYEYMM